MPAYLGRSLVVAATTTAGAYLGQSQVELMHELCLEDGNTTCEISSGLINVLMLTNISEGFAFGIITAAVLTYIKNKNQDTNNY